MREESRKREIMKITHLRNPEFFSPSEIVVMKSEDGKWILEGKFKNWYKIRLFHVAILCVQFFFKVNLDLNSSASTWGFFIFFVLLTKVLLRDSKNYRPFPPLVSSTKKTFEIWKFFENAFFPFKDSWLFDGDSHLLWAKKRA